MKKNILKLEKSLSKLKKYHDYDDIEYRWIRDVRNPFNLSTDEDYCKPIRTSSAFNGSYNEYQSKEDKTKILSIKEYLNLIRPYLIDILNDHKTQGEWKVHSSNKVIDYTTQGKWKIQLIITMLSVSYNSCIKLWTN